jgi:hypothetical protein
MSLRVGNLEIFNFLANLVQIIDSFFRIFMDNLRRYVLRVLGSQ